MHIRCIAVQTVGSNVCNGAARRASGTVLDHCATMAAINPLSKGHSPPQFINTRRVCFGDGDSSLGRVSYDNGLQVETFYPISSEILKYRNSILLKNRTLVFQLIPSALSWLCQCKGYWLCRVCDKLRTTVYVLLVL